MRPVKRGGIVMPGSCLVCNAGSICYPGAPFRLAVAMSDRVNTNPEEIPELEPLTGIRAPVWAHVIPFAAWLFIMQMLGDPAGWKYALRTLV